MNNTTKCVAETFRWQTASVEKELNTALLTLQKRYPRLSHSKGKILLSFQKITGSDECHASRTDNTITVTYGKLNMALRMVGNILSGSYPEKPEKSCFEMFGVMLDCSRNAVMTVRSLKSYLDKLAILGYNTFMLYTEETYTLEDEPFFGVMRGAYTAEEIREIDDYAAKLGIELIPCIQTLGHLEQIFRWPRFQPLNDMRDILLADEPETYKLIEKMLVFWKNNVRSRRIHLGMDEADGLGRGKYLQIHGRKSVFDVINGHLKKVVNLCKKHGLHPIIWSDMYFRIGSKTGDYYDEHCQIPESVVKKIPKEVQLVYWDYYHDNAKFYAERIEHHRAIAGDPIVAGSAWTSRKFWYNAFFAEKTIRPCIEACREKKARNFMLTLWGDDGAYCDFDSAFAGLAFSAELAFTGEAEKKTLSAKFPHLFRGADYETVLQPAGIEFANRHCILWDDPIMLLYSGSFMNEPVPRWRFGFQYHFSDELELKKAAAEKLAAADDKGDAGSIPFARAYLNAVLAKCIYAEAYLKAYSSDPDRRTALIPVVPLVEDYRKKLKKFIAEMRKMWFSHNKPFGFETVQIRLAGQLERTDELLIRLNELIDGKVENIPETDDLMKVWSQLHLETASYDRISHGTTIV